jgi:hypothetical protein
MPVNIHGKSYNTVAERIIAAGNHLVGVETEVLQHDPVVIKATITITKDEPLTSTGGKHLYNFTGISAANASKQIEKESPYEVAETSAVGRALAFAGYETTNGIASAEEMQKVEKDELFKEVIKEYDKDEKICTTCGQPMVYRTGVNKSSGKEWKGYFCPNKDSNPIFIH